MLRHISLVLLGLTFTFTACSSGSEFLQVDNADEFANYSEATAYLGGESFNLELANTEQRKQQGMSGRTKIGVNEGMLFPYIPAQTVSFWMSGMKIPLDMVFVSSNPDGKSRIIAMRKNVKPCLKGGDCPKIIVENSTGVLEFKAGTIDRLKLQKGEPVQINY